MTTDATAADHRRLYRPHEGRMVAGVCQGLGEYLDVDPVIFRVTLAVLAFFGGIGIVGYAAAWLLIPDADNPSTRLESWLGSQHSPRRRDAAIVIGVLIVLSLFFNGFLFAGHYNAYRFNGVVIVIATVLVVAALVSRSRQRSDTAAAGDTDRWGPGTWTPRASVGDTAPAAWVTPTVNRPPRSWLGWLTVGAAMIAAGVVSVLGVAGAIHPAPADVLAVSVGVIGLGLLVGTFLGRAWLLIPLGAVLALALAATDALPRNLTWTAGDRTWTPTGTTVSSPYVLGAGHATLDLTQLAPVAATSVAGRVGAGQLTVLLPPGAGADIRARSSAGEVTLFGQEHNGTGLDVHDTVAGRTPSAPTYTLNLQVGYGQIEVRHASS